ncbi:hypothetical protein BDN70DRAFT_891676 [Pholiota conissans]|uniref:Uncharacterized protein n=1 Tax=Pholiota conissans TaxID=109636 RepID=A0A9P5ZCV4_9AGAR|nr:hypothetical protein BDN70DRAFT_891676 [Pholiota conissans]
MNNKKFLVWFRYVSIITDDARGQHGNHTTYSDLNTEALNALPLAAMHRNVDIPIVEADKAGNRFWLSLRPLGQPDDPEYSLAAIAILHQTSIARKQRGYIGKGLNTWSGVDINDTADLFIIVFDAAISNPSAAGHGKEGYYFVENFEYSCLEVAQTISEKLVELGITSIVEPKAFFQEELDKNYGARQAIIRMPHIIDYSFIGVLAAFGASGRQERFLG